VHPERVAEQGFRMNVTVCCTLGTFLITYLYLSRLSAICTKGENLMSISDCLLWPLHVLASIITPIFQVSIFRCDVSDCLLRHRNNLPCSGFVSEFGSRPAGVPTPLNRVDVVVPFMLVWSKRISSK